MLTLFKYYPTIDHGYAPHDEHPTLTMFFRKHITECHPLAGRMFLDETVGFRLVTEATEDNLLKAAMKTI